MQKVKTDDKNHEFYVPQRLKDLTAQDFGPYAEKMVNCQLVLSNNI